VKRVLSFVLFSGLFLTGCSHHYEFIKKPGISQTQFFQDKVHCQSGASGQNQSYPNSDRLVPYNECMLKLGYSKK